MGHVSMLRTLSKKLGPARSLRGLRLFRAKSLARRQASRRRLLSYEDLEQRAMLAAWIAQGPFGSTNGQVEGITNKPVIGSVHALLAHPTNPDILYAGATNGGVWKTTNATSATPTWTTNTDNQSSISIGAMAFDRADPSFETVYAGNGKYSSLSRIGSARNGLLKSTDGGSTWTRINGGGILTGKNISGLVVNGTTIVASVNLADSFTYSNIGIYRSTNGGNTFVQVNSASATNGLPLGVSYDLIADPIDPNILYSSISIPSTSGTQGIYKSIDGGATWARVSNATMNALFTSNTSNVEMSAGRFGDVYAAIINSGVVVGLFRSPDYGVTWAAMDIPKTNENGTDVGLNPGGPKGPIDGPAEEVAGSQGAIHFSILADPSDANIVYVGGDRQPRSFGDTGSFPNSIGANDFSGRLFRGDASKPSGSQFVHLTHRNNLGATGGGTASNSSPHADSRDMVMDANGNIIESDDGGVYRRTSPKLNTGDWFSVIGNLQVTEMHDVAYDSVSNVLISGNQDTGTTYQATSGAATWTSWTTGDGGDVAIDERALAGSNQSIRYASFQNLGFFNRSIFSAAGTLVSTTNPARTVTSGAAFVAAFRTPLQVNAVVGSRLIIQGSNSTYESTDMGATIREVGAGRGAVSTEQDAIVYGGMLNGVANPDVLWVGAGSAVLLRTSAAGSLALVPSQPTTATIRDLTVDPDTYTSAAIVTSNAVFWTTNSGTNWTNITGNLSTVTSDFRSLSFVPGAVEDGILVGTATGIYVSSVNRLGTWSKLGTNFPNVPIPEIEFDATDDVLVAGTLGRGAWKLSNATNEVRNTLAGPSDLALSSDNLPENNSVNAVIGSFSTTDLTSGDTFTYALVSGTGSTDNSLFSLSGNTLSTTIAFNFETQSSYSIRVRTTDASGQSFEKPLTISVLDVNETPTSLPGGPYNAVEGVPVSLIGNGTDPDSGTVLTYEWDLNYDGVTFDVDLTTQSPTVPFADQGNQTIALRVTDNGTPSLSAIASATVVITNADPQVTSSNANVTGDVLATLTNTGTWSDVAADTVTLSSSLGAVTKNGDGTWNWTYTPDAAYANQLVTISAVDEDGGTSFVTFSLDALVNIPNRRLFYNGSGYETFGNVAAALDGGKALLKASSSNQTTTFANVSGYTRGINGVVFDIAGLANNTLIASDFVFRIAPPGASGVVTPSSWALAPPPTAIDVAPGNATTAARVRIEWPDNAIQNTWLQIIVNANANTGLLQRQVFYIGHALGEVDGVSPYRTTTADVGLIRAGVGNAIVPVDDVRDIDKDRRITTTDVGLLRARVGNTVLLNNITIPASGSGAEGELWESLPTSFQVQLPIVLQAGVILARLTDQVFTANELLPKDTSTNNHFAYAAVVGPPVPEGSPQSDSLLMVSGPAEGFMGLSNIGTSLEALVPTLDEYFANIGKKRARSTL